MLKYNGDVIFFYLEGDYDNSKIVDNLCIIVVWITVEDMKKENNKYNIRELLWYSCNLTNMLKLLVL